MSRRQPQYRGNGTTSFVTQPDGDVYIKTNMESKLVHVHNTDQNATRFSFITIVSMSQHWMHPAAYSEKHFTHNANPEWLSIVQCK